MEEDSEGVRKDLREGRIGWRDEEGGSTKSGGKMRSQERRRWRTRKWRDETKE